MLELTQSTQPNWVELYTEGGTDYAGKYLLLTSANKINNLYKSGLSTGYYSHDGAENGLFTYFTSDDGVNYYLMSTNVPTPWTQIAWKQLQVSGSTYYTKQIGGNYQIEKIGDAYYVSRVAVDQYNGAPAGVFTVMGNKSTPCVGVNKFMGFRFSMGFATNLVVAGSNVEVYYR